MNNKIIGTKPLYVSLTQHREVHRQQLEGQIAQRNQIRLQQAAAAGIPGGYINGPMYYPPNAGAYPPQGGRGILGYPPQPGMLVNLGPKVAYSNMMLGMPLHAPYSQVPPQGYGSIPGYPRGGAPRPPIPREGGPTSQPGIPRVTGAPAASGAPPVPRPGPQGSITPPHGAMGRGSKAANHVHGRRPEIRYTTYTALHKRCSLPQLLALLDSEIGLAFECMYSIFLRLQPCTCRPIDRQ
jgi:polyadenylate-binding protein